MPYLNRFKLNKINSRKFVAKNYPNPHNNPLMNLITIFNKSSMELEEVNFTFKDLKDTYDVLKETKKDIYRKKNELKDFKQIWIALFRTEMYLMHIAKLFRNPKLDPQTYYNDRNDKYSEEFIELYIAWYKAMIELKEAGAMYDRFVQGLQPPDSFFNFDDKYNPLN